jgi:hypothetical protein
MSSLNSSASDDDAGIGVDGFFNVVGGESLGNELALDSRLHQWSCGRESRRVPSEIGDSGLD